MVKSKYVQSLRIFNLPTFQDEENESKQIGSCNRYEIKLHNLLIAGNIFKVYFAFGDFFLEKINPYTSAVQIYHKHNLLIHGHINDIMGSREDSGLAVSDWGQMKTDPFIHKFDQCLLMNEWLENIENPSLVNGKVLKN